MIPSLPPSPSDPFSPGKVFTFLFVMIGPLEVIGPFAKRTSPWERDLERRLAFHAITIAAVLQIALGVQPIVVAMCSLGVAVLTSD